MTKNIAIVVLAGALVLMAAALVRVENQRYALQTGMCRDKATGLADLVCLRKVETRTSALWHLYYALVD